MAAQWIDNLPTATRAATDNQHFGTYQMQRAMNALRGGNGTSPAIVSSVIVTVIATFLVLVMLRPPVVTQKKHPHESPKVNISLVVMWSLAAGAAVLILSMV